MSPFVTRPDWHVDANCRGADPGQFFLDTQRTPAAVEVTTRALSICRACDVQVECLTDALNRGETHGVWGGLSAKERRLFRRKNGLMKKPGGQPQPITHGTNGGYHTHRRRGQQPCDACSQAHIRYERARREGGDAA